jgi:hypothetical protein
MKKELQTKLKKRFKNISSIDILGLFAIFFITSATYFFFSRKTEYLDITIKLFNQDTPEYSLDSNQPKSWYIEQIQKGKAQKSQFGESLIEIKDVYSYPSAYVYNDVYVTLRLKAVQNKITKQYTYESSPLLIHDLRSFKIQDLLLNGEIIDIANKPRELKKFKVKVELDPKKVDFTNNSDSLIKGVEKYVADLITTDLTIKDSNGQEIVKINKIDKQAGERIIATDRGLVYVNDPERVKVKLDLDIVGEKINNYYFYRKKETLLIGEQVWLTFEKVSVVGTIISVEAY